MTETSQENCTKIESCKLRTKGNYPQAFTHKWGHNFPIKSAQNSFLWLVWIGELGEERNWVF